MKKDSINYLVENFRLYLNESKKLSQTTVKNYLSDLRHFLSFLKLKSLSWGKPPPNSQQIPSLITPSLLKEYRNYFLANNIAKSTANRKLATVRLFCQFCYNKGLLEQNFAQNLKNIPLFSSREKKINDLVSKFGLWLKKQGASKNTIKNYVADIRAYLLSQQHPAHEL